MSNHKGFTLIELLVVISIIGLLASVVLSSLNSARVNARDTQRIAELNQIQLALEAYYAENGSYPYTDWISSNSASWQSSTLANNLEPYLPTLPVDPVNTASGHAYNGSNYVYSYFSTGYGSTSANDNHWYMLMANLENAGNEATYDQNSVACNGQVFNYSAVMLNGNCVK